MNDKTRAELLKVGGRMPRDIRRNLLVQEKEHPLEAELKARTEANIRKIEDPQKRAEVMERVKGGMMAPSLVRNPKAESEAEAWTDAQVRKLIASGKIPPPQRDSFIDRVKRATANPTKKADPQQERYMEFMEWVQQKKKGKKYI